MGMGGMIAGTLLASVAGTFVGTAIADAFLHTELRDAMEPVAQRAAVNAEFRGCGDEAPAVVEVGRQRRHQFGVAPTRPLRQDAVDAQFVVDHDTTRGSGGLPDRQGAEGLLPRARNLDRLFARAPTPISTADLSVTRSGVAAGRPSRRPRGPPPLSKARYRARSEQGSPEGSASTRPSLKT